MAFSVWLWSFGSVFIVSLLSLIGLISLGMREELLRKGLIYLISFSAGALIGDVFLHLLPDAVNGKGFIFSYSLFVLAGFLMFFALEKWIHWQHCHKEAIGEHVHSFAYMNLIGDGFHNLLDGAIIAASYLVSFSAGLATTLAVVLHEIPQEVGDFAVLLHGGFSKMKALVLNFVSALLAFVGALLVLMFSGLSSESEVALALIAAGGFLYIAGSDLIPELKKHSHKFVSGVLQVVAFVLGICVMALLLVFD